MQRGPCALSGRRAAHVRRTVRAAHSLPGAHTHRPTSVSVASRAQLCCAGWALRRFRCAPPPHRPASSASVTRGNCRPRSILFTRPSYPSPSCQLCLHPLPEDFPELTGAPLPRNSFQVTYATWTLPPPRSSYCVTDAGAIASRWDKLWSNLCSRDFCGIRLQ